MYFFGSAKTSGCGLRREKESSTFIFALRGAEIAASPRRRRGDSGGLTSKRSRLFVFLRRFGDQIDDHGVAAIGVATSEQAIDGGAQDTHVHVIVVWQGISRLL